MFLSWSAINMMLNLFKFPSYTFVYTTLHAWHDIHNFCEGVAQFEHSSFDGDLV